MTTPSNAPDTVVLLQQSSGIALIPVPTPLTRLNYFDGKFLRASDLNAEQAYHRRLQQLSARAAGHGVVHGFELQLRAGDRIELAPGLAIDPAGRVLHLPMEAAVQIEELIRRSNPAAAGGAAAPAVASGAGAFGTCESAAVGPAAATVVAGSSLYLLGLSHAEALCGREDVFTSPCANTCEADTERPQRLEGVVLRALPLTLVSALPDGRAEPLQQQHLRSRVAAAYFADEARRVGALISAAGLSSDLWCRGAGPAEGDFVPLAVLARAGGHTVFLDAWTARREHHDATPRRYWQWRMLMRPWDVFLAQVLQFQCQLRDAWSSTPVDGDDPCHGLRQAVVEVSGLLRQLDRHYQAATERLAQAGMAAAAGSAGEVPLSRTLLSSAMQRADAARAGVSLAPTDRVLIRRGIVELPPAGYLPVAPGSAFPVNEQVRRLMGEGVDLRFCVVRPDYVAHALEEAQHLERISLLRGLDNPQAREAVDVLVPDGRVLDAATRQGAGWEVRLASAQRTDRVQANRLQREVMTGAARGDVRADGAAAFFFAGLLETASRDAALAALKTWAAGRDNGLEQTWWKAVELQRAAAPAPAAAPARRARAAAATAAAAAEPTPQALSAHFAALREEAVAYRLKTAERVAKQAGSAGIRHFEGLNAAADGSDNDHTALWLALRTEADPFAVAEGSRVDMSMELSLISPKSGGTQYVDIGIVGAKLSIDSRVSSGQRQVVQGTLRGAALIAGLVGTLANDQRGLQFSVPVILSREPVDGGTRTRVEVDFSALLFDSRGFLGLDRLGVQADSADAGRRADVRIGLVSAEGVDVNLAAALVRNDAVLQLGHPLRAVSEAAIDVIATRESAPGFPAQARSDLFGQRAAQQDALSIQATLDWVLFHRRRERQCSALPTAPVLEQRRYELHHLKARNEAELRLARAAVLSANAEALRKLGFAPIGAVSFDGGRSSLATPTAALLQDWQAAQPGARLRLGAIGSQGAAQAEGEPLAQGRLAALELVLLQGQLDRAVENQVLPALPALGLAGWDGAIFLITQDVPVVCHDVMALPDEERLKAFAEVAARMGLLAAVGQFQLKPFAHVQYQEDGRTLQAESVTALRKAWGDGPPPHRLALGCHDGTTTASLATLRTEAIVKALGAAEGGAMALAVKDLDQVSGCAGVSVLVKPAPRFQVLVGWASWDGRFYFNADSLLARFVFEGDQPVDEAALQKGLKQVLNRQPRSLSAVIPKPTALPDPAPQLALAVHEVEGLGYTALQQQRTAALQDEEADGLKQLGFAPGSYDLVLVFAPQLID